jgi:hypothetical protein
MSHLRRLFDGPDRPDESDAARNRKCSPQALGSGVGSERDEIRDDRFQGRDFTQVDESRERADRAGEEGRSRAWRADDEYETVVEPSQALAQCRSAPRNEALGYTKLERG